MRRSRGIFAHGGRRRKSFAVSLNSLLLAVSTTIRPLDGSAVQDSHATPCATGFLNLRIWRVFLLKAELEPSASMNRKENGGHQEVNSQDGVIV
jgi:hypothetical protein